MRIEFVTLLLLCAGCAPETLEPCACDAMKAEFVGEEGEPDSIRRIEVGPRPEYQRPYVTDLFDYDAYIVVFDSRNDSCAVFSYYPADSE